MINHIISAPNITFLPTDNIIEIAFLGRSNTGKSSTINMLSKQQQKTAKTGKKPGCTKLINVFEIPTLNIRLIDFPGYGYPQTLNLNKKKQPTWETIINQYLKKRKNLIGVILIIDIRRSINKIDRTIIQQNTINRTPTLILLNKSDKLTTHESSIQLEQTKKIINIKQTQILIFSSRTSKGIQNLRNTIRNWRNNYTSTTSY